MPFSFSIPFLPLSSANSHRIGIYELLSKIQVKPADLPLLRYAWIISFY